MMSLNAYKLFNKKRICFQNILSFCVFFFFTFLFCQISIAAESLSYSGRLVNANGSPVLGPVDLKVQLSYTNAPTTILCSQDFTGVALSNGVFHLKLDLNCGGSSLTDILIAVPASEAASLRVKDVTNNKTYSFQAIHSMPFANISETAKQLVQMGATNGQILRWNDTTKKWEPGVPGGGGTVTNVTASAPLAVSNGGITPALSITQANTTTAGYLSSADWNIFNGKQGAIVAGTTAQYYRGDKSWQTLDTSAVAENIANLYFTNARVLGVPLTGFSVGAGAILNTDTVIEAFGKSQGQINAINTAAANYLIKNGTDSVTGVVNVGTIGLLQLGYAPIGLNDAANKAYVDTKLDLTGGTLSGDLSLNTQLKLKNGGASNYVTLKAPATGTTAYTLSLPQTAGSAAQVLTTDGAGVTSWTTPSSTATPSGSAGGDLTGTYPNPTIAAGKIVDSQVSATAAIAQSKIANLTTDLAAKELAANVQGDVRATTLTGYAVGTNTVLAATDSVLSAFQNVQGQLNAKEGAITAAATTTYFRGDKTFVTLDTGVVPENGNLYFTNARALGVPLTGFSATNSAIVATDSVLAAFNKAQGQINNLITGKASLAGDIFTGDVSFNTKIKLRDAGTNYVQIQAPAAVTSTYTITLPATAGSAAQVLTTDGAGVMSWTTPSTTATPSGSAGGDLSGTYPNPTIAAGKIVDATVSATANIAQSKIANLTTDLAAKQSTTLASGNILVGSALNVATAVPVSGDATLVSSGALSLKNTGTAGTYTSVTTDAQGRVTAGTNPTVVTSISGTAPVTVAGTAAVPVISMAAATTAVNGYLTSADWNIFNGKQAALTAGATINGIVYPANATQTLQIPLAPVNATDAVNKAYVDGFGQWATSAGNVYRTTGNVGIGTSSPGQALDVNGNIQIQNASSNSLYVGTVSGGNYFKMFVPTSGASHAPEIDFFVGGTRRSVIGYDHSAGRGLLYSDELGAGYFLFNGSGLALGTNPNTYASNALFVEQQNSKIYTAAGMKVGIGTGTPQTKLDVSGAVRIGNDATACSAAISGAMRFNTPNVEYCNGTAWSAFGLAGAAVVSSQITDDTIVDADINPSANITATKLGTGLVDNTELNYLNGVTSSIQTQLNGKQSTALASGNFLVGSVGNVATAVAMSGDATMINTGAVTLKNTGTAGTYSSVTTDAQGRVTAGTNPVVVTSITGTAPVTVAGTAAVPVISMAAATTAVNGYLTSTDWNTFNGKQAALSTGPTINGIVYPANAAQTLQIPLAPVALTDAVNKQYVDSFGQWATSAGNVYRSTGNVGIGTASPQKSLDVSTAVAPTIRISEGGSTTSYTDIIDYAASQLLIRKVTATGDNMIDVSPIPSDGVSRAAFRLFRETNTTGTKRLQIHKGDGTATVDSQIGVGENSWLNAGGGNVGIGTSTPSNKLSVQDTDANLKVGITNLSSTVARFPGVNISNYIGATAGHPWLSMANFGGDSTTPAAIAANSPVGGIGFQAYNGAALTDVARIYAFTEATYSGANSSGLLMFATGDAGGGYTEKMRITSAGAVGIGTLSPKSKLDVNGAIRVGIDATACSATISGAMRFNTPNVEYCNGTSWQAFGISGAAVASAQITDGTIVDADVAAAANITATKLGTGVVDNTEFNYLNGVTSAIQTQLDGKQASDITLTALAAYNTNGIMVQTAANTFVGRSIAGTANRIVVTNGDGVGGNPTANIDTTLLPSPVAGDAGKFLKASGANASVWSALGLSDITTALGFTPVNKAGDSLTVGTMAFSGTAALTVQNPVNVLDAVNKQYVDGFGQWTKAGSDIYRASNVGINVAAPTVPLDVAGAALGNTAGNQSDLMRLRNNNANANYLRFFQNRVADGTSWLTAETRIQQRTDATDQSYVSFSPDGLGGMAFGVGSPAVERLRISGTSGYVGIGTASPGAILDVQSIGADNNIISRTYTNTANQSGNFTGYRARGTASSPTHPLSGDILGAFTGRNAINPSSWPGMILYASENHSATSQGTEVSFVSTTNTQVGGTERMRITNNGNVGVGTAAPFGKISTLIDGTANTAFSNAVPSLFVSNSSTTDGTLNTITFGNRGGFTTASIGNLQNATNAGTQLILATKTSGGGWNSSQMVLDPSGNVGIGTANPSAKLEIDGGAGVLSLKPGAADHVYLQFYARTATPSVRTGYIGFPAATSTLLNISNETAAGPIAMLTAGAERVRIDSLGNVGIGTSAPSVGLMVEKDNGAGYAAWFRKNSTSMGIGIGTYASTDIGNIQGLTSAGGVGHISMQTAGGNVGIGTAAPSYLLDVNGAARANTLNGGQLNPSGNLHIEAHSAGATRGIYLNWYTGTGGAYVGNGGGTFGPMYAASFNVNSDRRLKTNIENIDGALDIIDQLNGVRFNWISPKESKEKQVGVIAQDVQKVLPELVSVSKETKKLTVNYSGLVSPLIEAVKELYHKWQDDHSLIAEQKREIASIKTQKADSSEMLKLKAANSRLEKENAEIKQRLDRLEKAMLNKK